MLFDDFTVAQKRFFSALGDETRLQILKTLRENGTMTVKELCKATGKEQSLISHHMACLRNCGLVNTRKNGKFTEYSIKNNTILRILELSEQHVRETLQGILACEVVE